MCADNTSLSCFAEASLLQSTAQAERQDIGVTTADFRLQEAFREAHRTRSTVFINDTIVINAEAYLRHFMEPYIQIDSYQTVLRVTFDEYYGDLSVESMDPACDIRVESDSDEGVDILKLTINGSQVCSDQYYRNDLHLEDEIWIEIKKKSYIEHPLNRICEFARQLLSVADRWTVWEIMFVPYCPSPRGELVLDMDACCAYAYQKDHTLFIETASDRFSMPQDMQCAFSEFPMLRRIWGLHYLDTSRVTDMSHMFAGCTLYPLDVTDLDTSCVTNMSDMFRGCDFSELVLDNFNTSRVINMSGMFSEVSIGSSFRWNETTIPVLDISSFDLSQVTNMEFMFNMSDICRIIMPDSKVALEPDSSCVFDLIRSQVDVSRMSVEALRSLIDALMEFDSQDVTFLCTTSQVLVLEGKSLTYQEV